MQLGRHELLGESAGNPNQPQGRHEYGVGFIPVGDRERVWYEYGIELVEERDSDPNIRRI